MSIEIKIHEPPVTFGMLPVGSTYILSCRPDIHRFKIAESGGFNSVGISGIREDRNNDDAVKVVCLPPGAELARPKAKSVPVSSLIVGVPYIVSGDVFVKHFQECGAAHFGTTRLRDGWSTVHGPQLSVQPCRVEVHVYPEYGE